MQLFPFFFFPKSSGTPRTRTRIHIQDQEAQEPTHMHTLLFSRPRKHIVIILLHLLINVIAQDNNQEKKNDM